MTFQTVIIATFTHFQSVLNDTINEKTNSILTNQCLKLKKKIPTRFSICF